MVIRKSFEGDMEDLKQRLLIMGSMVEETIAKTVRALEENNVEVAREIIEGDHIINQMEEDIETQCLNLIATQQPMAKDLRRITAALKIVANLERMADYAVNIAKTILRIDQKLCITELQADIPSMARAAQKVVQHALDAYVYEDDKRAKELAREDDKVDGFHKHIFQNLLANTKQQPQIIPQVNQLLYVSRCLERIADLSTNIGEEIIYLNTGERKELND